MNYLKISNKGELDIRLISLMGGTTKSDDPNKIGQFGTGLKYAISFLVRNEIPFKLFIGKREVSFTTKDVVIGANEFKEIHCDGRSMNITTKYGYQWKAWEAVREIWCNAKDEGGEQKKITSDSAIIAGVEGRTTFFIEATETIQEVWDSWDKYFMAEKPIFENENVAIYLNSSEDKKLKIYKNRVLIENSGYYKALFSYDLKHANLNELRQYQGYSPSDIGRSLLASNKEVVDHLLKAFKDSSGLIETQVDYSNLSCDTDHVKEIFQGYLFLHPDSDRTPKSRSVSVNKSLFYLLESCGLPTESVHRAGGRYYGGRGSGYYEDEEVTFTEVQNTYLKDKITKITEKYGSKLQFKIAVPVDSDFEILFDEHEGTLFNSDVSNLNEADLEATVLVAIFNQRDGNIFKAMKRLIKFARGNKAFEKILFGNQN